MDLDEEPMPLDILDRQMPELNRRQHTARGPVTSGGHRLGDTPTTVQEDTTTHGTIPIHYLILFFDLYTLYYSDRGRCDGRCGEKNTHIICSGAT
jgi:hypothetical protein